MRLLVAEGFGALFRCRWDSNPQQSALLGNQGQLRMEQPAVANNLPIGEIT